MKWKSPPCGLGIPAEYYMNKPKHPRVPCSPAACAKGYVPVRPPGGPQPWERLCLSIEPNGREYVYVEIYETHEDMLKAIRRDHTTHGCDRAEAAVISYKCREGKTLKVLGEVGTVYFCKQKLTPANIAHEFTHVAFRWARRRRMNLNSEYTGQRSPEERVAYVVGNMMHWFYASQGKRVYFIGGDGVRWKDLRRE